MYWFIVVWKNYSFATMVSNRDIRGLCMLVFSMVFYVSGGLFVIARIPMPLSVFIFGNSLMFKGGIVTS
jgi:predicted membrane channel-forming protein YqfA (hemolysin III family)